MIEQMFSVFASVIRYGKVPAGMEDHLLLITTVAKKFGWDVKSIRGCMGVDSVEQPENRRVFDLCQQETVIQDCDVFLQENHNCSICLIGINQTDVDQYRLYNLGENHSFLSRLSGALIEQFHYQLGIVAYEASLLYPSVEALLQGSSVFFDSQFVPDGLGRYPHRVIDGNVLAFSQPDFLQFVTTSGFSTDQLQKHLMSFCKHD